VYNGEKTVQKLTHFTASENLSCEGDLGASSQLFGRGTIAPIAPMESVPMKMHIYAWFYFLSPFLLPPRCPCILIPFLYLPSLLVPVGQLAGLGSAVVCGSVFLT